MSCGMILDVLMHANDPFSFQMCPGIDSHLQNALNLPINQNPIATFCQKFGVSCVNFVRPILLLLVWKCCPYI